MTAPAGTDAPLFPLRSVVLGAFVPTLVLEIGIGAMLPVVAVTATGRGASLTVAGLVAALVPIGKILFDLPAGALAQRIGDRAAMFGDDDGPACLDRADALTERRLQFPDADSLFTHAHEATL